MQAFSLIVTIVIVLLVIAWFRSRRSNGQRPTTLFNLSVSKEDGLSQGLLVLATLFFGVTLLALNRDLGEPLSWQTMILFPILLGYFVTYRYRVTSLLILVIISSVLWWPAQLMVWLNGKGVAGISIFSGVVFILLLLYQIGRLHEVSALFLKRFGLVYRVLPLVSLTAVFFFLSTKPGLSFIQEAYSGQLFVTSLPLSLSLFLLICALSAVTVAALTLKRQSVGEVGAIGLFALLFCVLPLLSKPTLFYHTQWFEGDLNPSGYGWAILFNCLAFGELIGLIILGYLKREEWLINLSTFFLIIFIVLKYFDWFFSFLDKSIFFIGAGILLFVIGWGMEKGRRYLLSSVRQT